MTLPLIYAMEDATPAERLRVETVLRERSYERVSFAEILAIVAKYRGVERAMERATMFTERSRILIHQFPDTAFQRALLSVTELVTNRDH